MITGFVEHWTLFRTMLFLHKQFEETIAVYKIHFNLQYEHSYSFSLSIEFCLQMTYVIN